MIYLISYDLRTPGRNYDGLYNILKSANSWWHYLESTWMIRTNLSKDDWNIAIKREIDANDYFIIIDITGQGRNSQGWLPRQAWDWLTQNDT